MIKANNYFWACGTDGENPWIQIQKTDDGYNYIAGVPTGDMFEHYETIDEIYNALYEHIESHYKSVRSKIEIKRFFYYDYDECEYDNCLINFLSSNKINKEIIKLLNTYGILVCKFIKESDSAYFIMTHSFFNKNKNKYKLKEIKLN